MHCVHVGLAPASLSPQNLVDHLGPGVLTSSPDLGGNSRSPGYGGSRERLIPLGQLGISAAHLPGPRGCLLLGLHLSFCHLSRSGTRVRELSLCAQAVPSVSLPSVCIGGAPGSHAVGAGNVAPVGCTPLPLHGHACYSRGLALLPSTAPPLVPLLCGTRFCEPFLPSAAPLRAAHSPEWGVLAALPRSTGSRA